MADDTFGTACLSDTLFSEFWPASLPQLTEIPSYMHIPLSDGSLSGFPSFYGDFPVLSNPQVHFPSLNRKLCMVDTLMTHFMPPLTILDLATMSFPTSTLILRPL